MSTRSAATLFLLAWSCSAGAGGLADSAPAHRRPTPALGQPLSEAEAAAWNMTVFPDGTGLPPGGGTAAQGRELFAARCAACHGTAGRGATADELAGERRPLDQAYPDKHIGNYWPFATTIFDFTRRAMPMNAPGSLSADEVYALTAYLLFANGIIGEQEEMNATTLPAVRMPNRDGFDWIDAPHPTAR